MQEVHLDYIVSAANLRAVMYGIAENRDRAAVAQMLPEVNVPEFTPKVGVAISVTDAEAQVAANSGSVGEYKKNG